MYQETRTKFNMSKTFEASQRVAIHLDNSADWLQLDKTLTQLDKVIVPVPHFFTMGQIQHMINTAGVDTVVCENKAQPMWEAFGYKHVKDLEYGLIMKKNIQDYPVLPKNTHKITFTSGTTSEPKGVCLSLNHLQVVAHSLAQITAQFNVKKHMSILPLSVLLENIATHYAADNAGIETISPSLSTLGFSGSNQLDIGKLVNEIKQHQPDSLILMPQILKALLVYIEQTETKLPFLKFIAVGGAVCSKSLLSKAHTLNLPVFEGYGISECGSVISLNTTSNSNNGVGKVLPHQQVKINADGEILTKGQLHCGYLGKESSDNEWYATGDIGKYDEDNNLHIIGRKRNTIINSFGRNISPDWIEAEMLSLLSVNQVAIYGEAKPFLTAIVSSSQAQEGLQAEVDTLNKTLPDYAQIKRVVVSEVAFTIDNKMITASGKIKHEQIFNQHQSQLENIYATA